MVAGGLGADETWPDYLATLEAVNGICELNGGKIYRKPSALDVTSALKKMCPSATPGQKDTALGRRRGVTLPTLDQARTEFDQYIGGHVQW